MFCTKCGAKIEDGLKFCPKCGQQLEAGDGGTPQKSSKKLMGIALKVIGFVLLAVAVFAYKYFTDGHSPYQIKKQTAELVEQCINKDETSKLIQFVKVEDLELEKQDASHYTGTAWVLLNRKENPAKDPMRFKYVLDVKVANDTITLEQKMHEDYVANYLIFLAGGTGGAATEKTGSSPDSNADLKTFVGVTFGTKPTDDKFNGPDEDGDYTFNPTSELGAFQIASVSLEENTKLIGSIFLGKKFENENIARKFLKEVNQNILRHYSQAKEQGQESGLWKEVVNSYAGMKYKDLRIYATSNDDGNVSQYVTAFLRMEESGEATVVVVATDATLYGQQNDNGEADYTNTTFEESEKLIAQWHELEVGEGMTSLQKEQAESQLIGKKIAVKGWVTNVGRTFENSLYVTITNSNPLHSQYYAVMQSNTDETVQSLHVGDPVILCGTFFKVMLGLNLNHGCVSRWNPDDDRADGNTADLASEYEAILREAMPVAMAMQGVPKDKIEAMVAEELKKEMTRFNKLSDEEKQQELNEAKEEILKIRALKKGGAEAKAVMDEIADSAAASALSMKGRNLFIAMMQANIDREAAGLPSVWPQGNASSSGKDIAEMRFKSSTEYFNILFDIPNKGKKPYVNWDAKSAISPDTKKAVWLVAQGVTDEMEDCVPVLVSANVDPSSLIVRPGQHDVSELAGSMRFTGKFAVVIRKGGSANVIKAGDATLKKVYNGESFALPKGFGYLSAE